MTFCPTFHLMLTIIPELTTPNLGEPDPTWRVYLSDIGGALQQIQTTCYPNIPWAGQSCATDGLLSTSSPLLGLSVDRAVSVAFDDLLEFEPISVMLIGINNTIRLKEEGSRTALSSVAALQTEVERNAKPPTRNGTRTSRILVY